MSRQALPLIVLPCFALACANNDHAGDDICWRLAAEPELAVGVVDGEPAYQLYQVTGVVPLADGAVAVANTGSHEVRVYGADGGFRWSVGGEGDGPGEFRGELGLARLPGDSQVVYDDFARRLTILSPDGAVARVAPVPDSLPNLELVGVFDDGTLVISSRHLRLSPGLNADSVVFHRVASSGRWLGPVTWVRRGHVFLAVFDGFPVLDDQPFAPRGTAAVGSVLALATGADPDLRVWTSDGRPAGRIAWDAGSEPVPLTEALTDRWREWNLADARDPKVQARWQQEVEMPETLPVSDRLVADDEGRFWVRPWVAPWRESSSDTVVWKVIDPAVGVVAEVPVPIQLEIRAVHDGRVIGVRKDDLDVERVEAYPIRR